MTEQEARELIAKALEADGWPNSAVYVRNGSNGAVCAAIRTLLPPLATSELQRRALEACETMADSIGGMGSVQSINADYHRARNLAEAIGRESLAVKKPKGPWRVENHAGASRVLRDDPAGKWIDCEFFGSGNTARAEAECSRLNAEWVREQNEREAAR